jgi:hypothetical protein
VRFPVRRSGHNRTPCWSADEQFIVYHHVLYFYLSVVDADPPSTLPKRCHHENKIKNTQNLAFACWRCDRHEGSDPTSFDPQTRELSPLFDPRTQVWAEHFTYEGQQIISSTPGGRTAVNLLRLNSEERQRERLYGEGVDDVK